EKRSAQNELYTAHRVAQADPEDPEDQRALKARDTLRGIDGLRDFLGSRGEATPLSDADVAAILARMSDSDSRPQVTIGLHKGDMVKIKSGAFEGFDGTVDEVN